MEMGGMRMSINEFIEAALRENQRIDGRTPFDFRRLVINFSKGDDSAEVQLGQTRVLAVVSAQLVQPYPDRPNEGTLAVFTEFSPMADPRFEPGRPGEMAVELGRIIDRGLRESKAVDTESLCVLAGRSVWAIRLDIHILDNGGKSGGTCCTAFFLKARVHVRGARCPRHHCWPPEVWLSIHHLPIAVTFAFLGDGGLLVLDPSLKEELVMGGRLTITVNTHGEVCSVQKGGGVGVSASELVRCLRLASTKAAVLTETLKKVGARTVGHTSTAGSSNPCPTDLWEQFRDGLEVCGYFGGLSEGSPEHAARIKAAETTFENSLKKFRCSTTEEKDAQIVAEAFKVQGNVSMKEQRFLEAIQFYTLAISPCGNNAIFYANRAAAHSEVNKFAKAIVDCENVVRIDPKYSKAYSRLGWVYHAQGHFEEAIEKGFQKALDLDLNNATAKENLMAAQQKLAEQHRGQSHQQQEPEQQSQNPFGQGGIPGFGGAMPENVQLPPEMANLISGMGTRPQNIDSPLAL